jgi:hypothetical protein
MKKGLRNMRLQCILLKNSGEGAHRVESETGCRHDEGANDAAPPVYSLLGLRPAVASGTPTPLLASGDRYTAKAGKHTLVYVFLGYPLAPKSWSACGLIPGFSSTPFTGLLRLNSSDEVSLQEDFTNAQS